MNESGLGCLSGDPKHLLDPERFPLPHAVLLPRHLNKFADDDVDIVAVPLYGHTLPNLKAFMVRHMVEKAKAEGKLHGVHTFVEGTSGNTGASLAIQAPHHGVKRVVAIVARDIAPGKLELLRFAGAEPRFPEGNLGAIETANLLANQKGWYHLNQYANDANWEAHRLHTGPHVWRQTGGKITVFCAGLGTTGTIIGGSKFLKQQSPGIVVVGVILAPGHAVPGVRTEERLKEIAFDWRAAVDNVVYVKTKPSYKASLELCRGTASAFGPSSGFACAGLSKFLDDAKKKGKLDSLRNGDGRVVAAFICGDTPFHYLDKYSMILGPRDFDPLDVRRLAN